MASSASVASGSVISEIPAAGAQVAAGSAVNLTVTTGPAGPGTVAVPNVVGMTQAAASTAITAAGLKVGTVTMASCNTVASGSVISESPVARGVLTHLGFHYTHDEFYPPTGQIEPCYLLLQDEFPGFSAP
jgi:beta-lactam-binding protein with PASTA domain